MGVRDADRPPYGIPLELVSMGISSKRALQRARDARAGEFLLRQRNNASRKAHAMPAGRAMLYNLFSNFCRVSTRMYPFDGTSSPIFASEGSTEAGAYQA